MSKQFVVIALDRLLLHRAGLRHSDSALLLAHHIVVAGAAGCPLYAATPLLVHDQTLVQIELHEVEVKIFNTVLLK